MPRGREVKKGTTSKASLYIDRDRALFKLQLTLRDFRKLCILKGIYPRVPPNDVKKKNKTHYLKKDIMFLMHDPIIKQIRKYKTYRRKLRKFNVRKERSRAESLKATRPDFNFDHMIKERYPTFVEALRDLDDAVSMVFLFATLPQNRFLRDHVIERCGRLSNEWTQYIIKSRSMRRVFCSIKGIYFQASVMGELVTWLSPYPYTPNVPENVDFKVMITFLEFHMKFVMFRLYGQMGLSYPPIFNQALASDGATVMAYQFKAIEPVVEKPRKGENADDNDDDDDDNDDDDDDGDDNDEGKGIENEEQAKAIEAEVEKIQSNLKSLGVDLAGFDEEEGKQLGGDEAADNEVLEKEGDEFRQLAALSGQSALAAELDPLPTLFRGLVVFIGRENLRDVLYTSLASCGASVGWDGPDSPFNEQSEKITHIICDRPSVSEKRIDVEYVQPQWVFDSINFAFLLPVNEYLPGKSLPPHLSPFVNDEQEGYVPERKKQILRYIEQAKAGGAPLSIGGGEEDEEAADLNEDELDQRDVEELYQEGLEIETSKQPRAGDAAKRAKQRRRERELAGEAAAEEEKALAAGTLTRKKRRLFERIQYSKKKKEEKADGLKLKAKVAKLKSQK